MNDGVKRVYSVLEQVDKLYTGMTPVETRIADYVLENPELVINMSVKEIASTSNTSDAAIVRFAKRIGLTGIKELKVELAKELHTVDDKVLSRNINLGTDGEEEIFVKVFQNTLRSLYNTEKIIDRGCLVKAAVCIVEAERLFIYGVADSTNVGLDFEQKLLRANINAFFTSDRTLMMQRILTAKENDVLFIVSGSGKSRDVIEVMKFARQHKVEVIILTQKNASQANRLADLTIGISDEETNVNEMNMTSRISQLMVCDVLFFYICRLLKEDPNKEILNILSEED